MKRINILFGFKTEKTAEAIVRSISMMGYSVNTTVRDKKQEMAEYIKEHPELDAVVLKEYLDGGGELGTEDLIELADDNKVNFVVVLDVKKRGQDSMKDLYAAGILNAYFSDGKTGANADNLARLAVNGRTHKEAREYYRIDKERTDHKYMSFYEFKDLYRYLISDERGINIADRFVALTRWIDQEQLAFFIKTLPKQTKEELCRYREFVDINNTLYKKHLVDYRYRLSDAEDGITSENIAHKMVEEHLGRKSLRLMPEPVAVNSSDIPDEEEPDVTPVEERASDDIYAYAARFSNNKTENTTVSEELIVDDEVGVENAPLMSDTAEIVSDNLPVEDSGDPVAESSEVPEASVDEQDPVPDKQFGKTMPLVLNAGKNESIKKTQRVNRGFFSALKERFFDPERGMVTLSETPVMLDDISYASENAEFSLDEQPAGVSFEVMPKEALGDEESAAGVTNESNETPSALSEPEQDIKRINSLNAMERENAELKARLMAMQESVKEVKKEKQEMAELLKKAMDFPGTANTEHVERIPDGSGSAVGYTQPISKGDLPQEPVTPNKQNSIAKTTMVPRISEDGYAGAQRDAARSIHNSGASTASEKAGVKPKTGNGLEKTSAGRALLEGSNTSNKNKQNNKEKRIVHNKAPKLNGQTSIDELIAKWAE